MIIIPRNSQEKQRLRQDKECKFCKTDENLTLDHIIRLADGGSRDMKNTQVLCSWCHKNKERLYSMLYNHISGIKKY